MTHADIHRLHGVGGNFHAKTNPLEASATVTRRSTSRRPPATPWNRFSQARSGPKNRKPGQLQSVTTLAGRQRRKSAKSSVMIHSRETPTAAQRHSVKFTCHHEKPLSSPTPKISAWRSVEKQVPTHLTPSRGTAPAHSRGFPFYPPSPPNRQQDFTSPQPQDVSGISPSAPGERTSDESVESLPRNRLLLADHGNPPGDSSAPRPLPHPGCDLRRRGNPAADTDVLIHDEAARRHR